MKKIFRFSMLSLVILLSFNFFQYITNTQALQRKSENKGKKFYRIGYRQLKKLGFEEFSYQ